MLRQKARTPQFCQLRHVRFQSASSRNPNTEQEGFTLIELLVVMAVIAIIAAILIPTLSTAKERSRRAKCTSNLKQFGIAHATYSVDNHGNILETDQVNQ